LDLIDRLRNSSINANVTVKVDGNWSHFDLIEGLRHSSINANVTVKVDGNWAHFDLIERLRNQSVNANVNAIKLMETSPNAIKGYHGYC